MNEWEIPEAFRLVDLTDPCTWHYASIGAWFTTRDNVLSKLPSENERKAVTQLFTQAKKRLNLEEKKRRKKGLGNFLSGRQQHRLQEIITDAFAGEDAFPQNLTPWEKDFLQVSEWVETVRFEYRGVSPQAVSLRILVEMSANNEKYLAPLRKERLRRMVNSFSGEPGTGMSGGKIAYLPEPIELFQIYRLATLFSIYIKKAVMAGIDLQLSGDRYGSVYPCRDCGEKYDHVFEAEQCCGINYTVDEIEDHCHGLVLGSKQHISHARVFLHYLWQFGYSTPASLSDFIKWSGWEQIVAASPGAFSRDLLGFLFKAKPETIRRKITATELNKEYKRHCIPPELRDLPGKESFGISPAMISPRGWYLGRELGADGVYVKPPSKEIGVHKWSSMLSYRSPLSKLIAPKPVKKFGHEE